MRYINLRFTYLLTFLVEPWLVGVDLCKTVISVESTALWGRRHACVLMRCAAVRNRDPRRSKAERQRRAASTRRCGRSEVRRPRSCWRPHSQCTRIQGTALCVRLIQSHIVHQLTETTENKFGLRQSAPSSLNFASSDPPLIDLSVGDILWQIAPELSQWRAYRKTSSPFRMVPSLPTVTSPPLPQKWEFQMHFRPNFATRAATCRIW